MADVDATLKQKILYLPKRAWIADVHHHREADHLGWAVEIMEGILYCRKLWIVIKTLKPFALTEPIRTLLSAVWTLAISMLIKTRR